MAQPFTVAEDEHGPLERMRGLALDVSRLLLLLPIKVSPARTVAILGMLPCVHARGPAISVEFVALGLLPLPCGVSDRLVTDFHLRAKPLHAVNDILTLKPSLAMLSSMFDGHKWGISLIHGPV